MFAKDVLNDRLPAVSWALPRDGSRGTLRPARRWGALGRLDDQRDRCRPRGPGVPQFLERCTGVTETDITDRRGDAFGDPTSAFQFRQGRRDPPPLPDNDRQFDQRQAASDGPAHPAAARDPAGAGQG